MTEPMRRALTIDDPVAGRDAWHVARPAPSDASPVQVQRLPVNQIRPNSSQPRKQFDAAALSGLADSIRERGMLQPIIVRPVKGGGFEIVAGERRWRAAWQAGQLEIPALIETSFDGAELAGNRADRELRVPRFVGKFGLNWARNLSAHGRSNPRAPENL